MNLFNVLLNENDTRTLKSFARGLKTKKNKETQRNENKKVWSDIADLSANIESIKKVGNKIDK